MMLRLAMFSVTWLALCVNGRAAPPVDFAHDVVPILKRHCVACHGGDKSEGGFSLNSRELILDAEAVVVGRSDVSRLVELIESREADEQMPPKDRPRLSPQEVATLRGWVDQGLRWEGGFSFAGARYEPPLRPRRPELPPPREGRDHPVDRILDAYLAAQSLPPPAPLDDAAFLRRLWLDVIGRLPRPDELETFRATTDSDRRLAAVERVLSDREAYAEHWLTFWNDLLRNDYAGTGYIDGGRKQITGWLYRALLENKPYDQMVQELIAPSPESAGFIHGIKWRGNVNASQVREIQFAQNLGQVFLGINLKCASCHDSFIDRWTLEETYGLAAVYATQPLEIHRCDKPTGQMAEAAWLFPELGTVDTDGSQQQRLEELAALMTHPENGRFTRTLVNRLWHRLMGRGIVHPVDAMHTRPWSEDLLDYLAVYLVDHDFDLKQVIHLIVTSKAYQSQAVALADEPSAGSYRYLGPLAKRLTAEQFVDAVWDITGTWPKPDAAAFRLDGRQQGGQLAAVLRAAEPALAQAPEAELVARWGDRPVRAALTRLDALQAGLGRPHREQVVTTRPNLLTTLEAIQLSNGPILAETLRRGAERLLEAHGGNTRQLVDRLYLHALSRHPGRSERRIAEQMLGAEVTAAGVEDLLWAVLMLPEFQIVR